MKLSSKFPKYELFDPLVPIRCVTPDRGGCIHRFFDTSPISPSGRLLAAFRLPFQDRLPLPGETGEVLVIDLEAGTERIIAETRGWEPQTGANLNWGASDAELFFNDVDAATWRPFAWKINPATGERHRMEGAVYHASPDGRWLISADLAAMRTTQSGYGVRVPDEFVRRNVGAADDDGFYLTDTLTGKCRLLVSIRDMLERACPPVRMENPSAFEIYGFHAKFNPGGDRVMLSLRWFPALAQRRFDLFRSAINEVRYAWITMWLDGSFMHCAVGPEQWEKSGHHATWFPDGRRISMNLDIDREGLMRFVRVDFDGGNLRKMRDDVIGSGHPTVYPDGRHILTDAYTWEKAAFGDGTVPLRWVDLATGGETLLARINTKTHAADGYLRVDPHPAWDRSWRYVTFNAFIGGTRRIFVADMERFVR